MIYVVYLSGAVKLVTFTSRAIDTPVKAVDLHLFGKWDYIYIPSISHHKLAFGTLFYF